MSNARGPRPVVGEIPVRSPIGGEGLAGPPRLSQAGTFAVVALCAAALAFGAGLLTASLTGGSLEVAIAERNRLRDRVEELERELAEPQRKQVAPVPAGQFATAAWGRLEPFAAQVGPGSLLHGFLERLPIDPDRYWVLGWTFRSPEAHLCLTVVGEGKVYIEAVVEPYGETLWADVMFRPGETCDLKLAAANRNDQIRRVAQAMQLNEEEIARLDAVLARLPLAQASSVNDAMLQFARAMPQRVQDRFMRCVLCYVDPQPTTTVLNTEGPAIGLPLSERYVVEVAFVGTRGGQVYKDVNCLEPGPWWSLVIHDPIAKDHTSPEEPEDNEGRTFLPWPRLTETEMETLCERSME